MRFKVVPLRKEDKEVAQQAEAILDLYQKGLINQVEMERQLHLTKPAKELKKENLNKVLAHPTKDAYLITPYSGKTFEIDATEIEEKNLCVKCLVEKAKLTERKAFNVYCLEDKQKYTVTICPIHYKGSPMIKLRLIERIPKKMDLDYFKKRWFEYTEFARRVKYLDGKKILDITPEHIKTLDTISDELDAIDIANASGKFVLKSDEDGFASSYFDWQKQVPGKIEIGSEAPSLQIYNSKAYGKLMGIDPAINGSHFTGIIQDDLIDKIADSEKEKMAIACMDGEERFFKIWEKIKKKIEGKKERGSPSG